MPLGLIFFSCIFKQAWNIISFKWLFEYIVKYIFQHHYFRLQCQHFWLLSMLKTVVLLNIFVETVILFFFPLRILWWIESKKQHLFEIEKNGEMLWRWIWFKALTLCTIYQETFYSLSWFAYHTLSFSKLLDVTVLKRSVIVIKVHLLQTQLETFWFVSLNTPTRDYHPIFQTRQNWTEWNLIRDGLWIRLTSSIKVIL